MREHLLAKMSDLLTISEDIVGEEPMWMELRSRRDYLAEFYAANPLPPASGGVRED